MTKKILKLEDLSAKDRKALETFVMQAGSLEAAKKALDNLAQLRAKAA